MKTVAEMIGVARSNLIERLRERPRQRIGRPPEPDDEPGCCNQGGHRRAADLRLPARAMRSSSVRRWQKAASRPTTSGSTGS